MLVENFQTHEKCDIEFDPLITTLVGPSDVGKSSLLRALRWCCLNRPRGDGFIRHNSKWMRVRLKVDDTTIRRERGGSENVYALDKAEYRAFGNDVPDAIQQRLKVCDLNFVGQHDPPFWFNLSPPELARQLNKMVDLDAIDQVTSRLAQQLRQLATEAKVVDSRLVEAQQEYKDLAYAVRADDDLKVVEKWDTRQIACADLLQKITQYVDGLTEAQVKLQSTQQAGKAGDRVVELGDLAMSHSKQLSQLNDVIGDIEEHRDLIGVKVPSLDNIGELGDAADGWASKAKLLGLLISSCQDDAEDLDEAKGKLDKAQSQLTEELDGRCPLCGGEMK
jgi:DNA repair exonuclease SbcCD ATPase subunit